MTTRLDRIRQEQQHVTRLTGHIERLEHLIKQTGLLWIGIGDVPQEIIAKNTSLREQQQELIKEREIFEAILNACCVPLLELCGENIHAAVQEKYHVNGQTTVERVPDYMVSGGRFYRALPRVMNFADPTPTLAFNTVDHEAIVFDLWAECAECPRWKIGYSNVTNTLFVVVA
jgi:hypothetical protein